MLREKILIVDDEETIRVLVEETIKRRTPFEPIVACDGREAMQIVRSQPINLVITDLIMPNMDGRELLAEVRNFNPNIPVIILTCYGTIDNAVDLLRQGAYDYITKPFQTGEFLQRVDKAMETLQLKLEISKLRERLGEGRGQLEGIIGNSKPIVDLLKKIPAVARSDVAVILYGESGTGKELFAKAIHNLSNRKNGPFITVNCGALPDNLLENELFGHVKGAYTDALCNQEGMVAQAHQGTLFLDEIGDISLNVQVKLLRFLQEKEFKPLGSALVQKADVRIIAATNRNLPEEVKAGRFREDLFYRINIIPLELPPVRDRKEDIPLMVNHFLRKYRHLHGGKIKGVSPLALQRLMNHDWPGNVRELENKIQQLVVMTTTNVILEETLGLDNGQQPANQVSFGNSSNGQEKLSFKEAKRRVVEEFERTYIARLLTRHKGNITRAAKDAQKNRRAFWQLMKKYSICAADYSAGDIDDDLA